MGSPAGGSSSRLRPWWGVFGGVGFGGGGSPQWRRHQHRLLETCASDMRYVPSLRTSSRSAGWCITTVSSGYFFRNPHEQSGCGAGRGASSRETLLNPCAPCCSAVRLWVKQYRSERCPIGRPPAGIFEQRDPGDGHGPITITNMTKRRKANRKNPAEKLPPKRATAGETMSNPAGCSLPRGHASRQDGLSLPGRLWGEGVLCCSSGGG